MPKAFSANRGSMIHKAADRGRHGAISATTQCWWHAIAIMTADRAPMMVAHAGAAVVAHHPQALRDATRARHGDVASWMLRRHGPRPPAW